MSFLHAIIEAGRHAWFMSVWNAYILLTVYIFVYPSRLTSAASQSDWYAYILRSVWMKWLYFSVSLTEMLIFFWHLIYLSVLPGLHPRLVSLIGMLMFFSHSVWNAYIFLGQSVYTSVFPGRLSVIRFVCPSVGSSVYQSVCQSVLQPVFPTVRVISLCIYFRLLAYLSALSA